MRLIKLLFLSLSFVVFAQNLSNAQPLLSGYFVKTDKFILDEYPGAAAAYSVRRLSSTYTGALIEVRRSSDNTTQDIGYDANGDLDTTALLSFVGAGDGFIRTWYDQSGNGNNATQTTTTLQPLIVSSGSVNQLGTTPKPAINFNNDYLDTPLQNDIQGFLDVYKSFNLTSYSPTGAITLGSTTSGSIFYQYSGTNFLMSGTINSIAVNDGVHRLTNFYQDGTLGVINHNNTDYTNTVTGYNINSTNRVFRIGAYPAGSSWNFIGNMQEFIIYSGNQSANKAGIKSNINAYFLIY